MTLPMTPEAVGLIRAATDAALGPIPAYGSDEWSALPPQDPRRAAAFAIAAEAWRDYFSDERIAERLEAEIGARRRGWLRDMVDVYRAAQESILDTSADVGEAADWREVANELDAARRTRARRAQLNDSAPRAGDFPGRAPSSRVTTATPSPDPYRCAICGQAVQPTQRTLERGFDTVCQRCDLATASPGAGDSQRRSV